MSRVAEAAAQVRWLVEAARRDGGRRLASRVLQAASERVGRGEPPPLPVRPDHLLAPAAGPPAGWRPRTSGPYTITWIANPPGETSGGMSTLMHAVELLEGRGHTCRIAVLYRGVRHTLERDRSIARTRFPDVAATFEDFDDGLRPSDAIVATAWPTAFALRASGAPGVPFYLVQDHEPSFYPVSSSSVLAEQTYGFGFYGITAGRWLATTLERDHDMACTAFDLGVDLECYRPPVGDAGDRRRDGVVFYARPDTPRRGYELGMAALALVAERHPGVPIHLVGQDVSVRDPGFAFVGHGRCAPEELAAIYRTCSVGLVLSLTNLSLLPAELLATGCIPVMNDADNVRASFDNPWARLAPPRPDALAAAIGAVLDDPLPPASRAAAAASVGSLGWPLVADRLELALGRGIERWRQRHATDEPRLDVPPADAAIDLRAAPSPPAPSGATEHR